MKQILVVLSFVVTVMTSPLAISVNPSSVKLSNVPDLVSAWAKTLNKPLVWEAGSDYDGHMVQFEYIDTAKAGAFERAFAGLSRVLEKAGHIPLKVCIFHNAMVVRRVTQPDCNQQI
jgi:hypothetical protein